MAEEIFDVVDENGKPTGETVTRSQAHDEGIRHRTAHIWVVRNIEGDAEVLLQKRAMNKDSFPGRYDTSSAGHVQAGDEPLNAAIRELGEELGILANKDQLKFAGKFPIQYEKEFHGKPFKDNEVAFVYVYAGEVDESKLTIQTEELERVDWFKLEEVYEACQPPRDEKFCVPLEGLTIVRNYVNNEKEEIAGSLGTHMSLGMCIGLAVGTAIGAAVDNIPVYTSMGLVLGMLFGLAMGKQK